MYAVRTVLMNKKNKGMNLLLNKDEKMPSAAWKARAK